MEKTQKSEDAAGRFQIVDLADCPARKDMAAHGIGTLYLLTDHEGFYERYGWEFLCMVRGGDPEPSRMYVHRQKSEG